MRQANGDHTTPARSPTAVTENTHAATVALLRDLANRSAAAMVTEGPVHPDQKLLDLADAAMQVLSITNAYRAEILALWMNPYDRSVGPMVAAKGHEIAEAKRAARPILRRLGTIPATTPAGVVAKALCVRLSGGSAARLGQSLAEDLLACPAIRRALMQDVSEGDRS